MSCKLCNRVVHSAGLCRDHWEKWKGRSGSTRSYAPRREDAVPYHGLTVEKRTSEAIDNAASETGLAPRSVMGCILDSWAIDQVWRRPEPVMLGGLVLALLLASSWMGLNCAHPQPAQEPVGQAEPPPAAQVEDPDMLPGETHTSSGEQEQQAAPVRRGIPLKPGPNQKTPPCDPDMGEEAIRGACYVPVLGKKAPNCGRLLEHDGLCYRAVAKVKEMPVSVEPREPEE